MRIHHALFVVSFFALTLSGCGSPITPQQWQQTLREANEISGPQRNYVTNPYTLPRAPQMSQPDFGADGSEYRTVMVNTPNGIVYKRCKVLNGQVVACF